MLRTMMKSKIHRATVTQADLRHIGSVTVDEDLLDAAEVARALQPSVVFVDERNRVVSTGTDAAQAPDGSGLTRGDAVVSGA